jgi:mono/diheme cytochrome c family protein
MTSMTTTRLLGSAILLCTATLSLAACTGERSEPRAASLTPPFLDTPVAPKPAADQAALVERGRALYAENCAQCHGDTGAGDGFGAPFLVPPPRDLVSAEYKFRTTSAGLPTDDDLFRIISRGANGTGMPPWHHLLNDEELWSLVEFVKALSPKFAQFPDRKPMDLTEPPAESGDADRGRTVYAKMQCAQCHGEDGRGTGPQALAQKDSKGRFVNTRDLTNPGSFRTGWTAREIVRTLDTGMNGVPMPSYAQAMTAHEKYDLAAFVMSLAASGGGHQKRSTAQNMEGVGAPDRVITLREHKWQYEPAEIRIKAGEVVRIDFSVTDNGLGAGHGFAIDGFDQNAFINGSMVGAPLSVTFRIDEPGRYKFYCATQCSTTELHPRMNGVLIVE